MLRFLIRPIFSEIISLDVTRPNSCFSSGYFLIFIIIIISLGEELCFFKVPERRLRNNSKMREINLSLGPAGPVCITFVALAGILTELWPCFSSGYFLIFIIIIISLGEAAQTIVFLKYFQLYF